MSDDSDNSNSEIIYRNFDPDDRRPETDIIATVADLENEKPAALSPLYTTIDDVISKIFTEPPSQES